MKLFGVNIPFTREKASVAPTDLSPTYGGWSPFLYESFSGAWQRGVKIDKDTALTFSSLYACVTLIASDIAKLPLRLVRKDSDGIWNETESPAFSPVLRRPNRYQNRIQFIEHWMLSKLIFGNTYVLKVRDNRGGPDETKGNVIALYILDPRHVQTLEAPGAAVFYRLQADMLTTVDEAITVPASEIIHDRMPHLGGHPLVGVSPISACGLASMQGIEILKTSSRFFENGARPGGILTAPGAISEVTAQRIKAEFEKNYTGENVGRMAVLGDGLKFEHMSVNPVDAQLIEQLKMSSHMVCTAFHVPPFKVGVGDLPTYQNAAILKEIYYSDCLQKHIEDLELALDEGLRLPNGLGVEFDRDELLGMDAQTKMAVLKEGVSAKIYTPNEARKRVNLRPKGGGDDLWGQQQDHSLEALAERDRVTMPDGSLIPQATLEPLPAPEADDAEDDDDAPEDQARRMLVAFERSLAA